MEHDNKRVYALYRVSTLGQVEKDDIPMQKQCCRDFAEQKGWTIVKEFSEKGVSGYKKSAKDRDAIQQLRQAAIDVDRIKRCGQQCIYDRSHFRPVHLSILLARF